MSRKETANFILQTTDIKQGGNDSANVNVNINRKSDNLYMGTVIVPIPSAGSKTLDQVKQEAVDKADRLNLDVLL